MTSQAVVRSDQSPVSWATDVAMTVTTKLQVYTHARTDTHTHQKHTHTLFTATTETEQEKNNNKTVNKKDGKQIQNTVSQQ